MTNPYVNIASEAAHRAGQLAVKYRSRLEGIPVERKARHDYVSDVDRACEQVIREYIGKHHRDHAILGEEGGQTGHSDYVWIVDPIDGTSNYLRGIPHFAISPPAARALFSTASACACPAARSFPAPWWPPPFRSGSGA